MDNEIRVHMRSHGSIPSSLVQMVVLAMMFLWVSRFGRQEPAPVEDHHFVETVNIRAAVGTLRQMPLDRLRAPVEFCRKVRDDLPARQWSCSLEHKEFPSHRLMVSGPNAS
jgi:hypothetical protein